MKAAAAFLLALCVLSLTLCSVEGSGSLRKLDDRESAPADVFVEDPAPAPVPPPTPADDVVEDAPAGDGGDEDDFGNDEDDFDDEIEPTPAPTVDEDDGDDGDAGDDAGDTEDAVTESTPAGDDAEGATDAPEEDVATTAAADEAEKGGEGDGTEVETTVPTQAPKTEITSEPTQAPKTEITSEPTQAPVQDDYGGDEAPTDQDDDEDPWDNYTPPTEQPVVYVPPDEEEDPIKNQTSGGVGSWVQEGESPEEMIHDRNVLIAVGVLCGLGILLMIITAHQMVENPDGCCARCVCCVVL